MTTVAETAPHPRHSGRRAIALGGVLAALGLAGLGSWLATERSAPSEAVNAIPATPLAPSWLDRLEAISAERQLVRAGYSIKADGDLDPVAKSALADYLQPDSAHPLSPFLAAKLEGTVITGLRDPAAWNNRFGLNRPTRFVERPLTGPGGQLDRYGNIVQR